MSPEPYDEETATNALARIANGSVPTEFCNGWDPTVPTYASTIELWGKADPQFAERLAEAKRIGALVMVADCQRIATDRLLTPTERKLLIDTKMRIAALMNADCNPKTVVEQSTTVRNVTARQEYVETAILLLGITPGQAEVEYQRHTGEAVQ